MYEGVVFQPALRLVAGEPTFGITAAMNPPYVFPLYGPLYYAILGCLLKAFGICFWPGRLLSVCAACGLFALLIRHGRRASLSFERSLLLASVFLMLPGTVTFFTLQRVDALSVLLAALGASIVLGRRPSAWRVALGGMVFAAAALVKPATCGLMVGTALALAASESLGLAGLMVGAAAATFFGVIRLLILLGIGDYLFNLSASLHGGLAIANLENVLVSVAGSPLLFVFTTFCCCRDLISPARTPTAVRLRPRLLAAWVNADRHTPRRTHGRRSQLLTRVLLRALPNNHKVACVGSARRCAHPTRLATHLGRRCILLRGTGFPWRLHTRPRYPAVRKGSTAPTRPSRSTRAAAGFSRNCRPAGLGLPRRPETSVQRHTAIHCWPKLRNRPTRRRSVTSPGGGATAIRSGGACRIHGHEPWPVPTSAARSHRAAAWAVPICS